MKQVKTNSKSPLLLIWLCWLVYATSYIGKVNYAANINPIIDRYGITHAEAGLVSTLFFFAYGIGQVFNGLFSKRYNIKWVVFGCLMLSGLINLSVPFLPSFSFTKYLWAINGFSLSVLWPILIRLLSEALPAKHTEMATAVMGTTIAVGSFFVYGISALFSLFTSFEAVFYTSAAVLITVGLIWIVFLPRILNECNAEEEKQHSTEQKISVSHKNNIRHLIPILSLLAIFGIISNLIKDGLITWVPSILKEGYGLDDSLSIILTLALPLISIFGNRLALVVHRKITDYIYHCAVIFTASAFFIGAVIIGFKANSLLIAIFSFTIVSLLVASINSLITSIFPLFMKESLNSGLIAGILNGFCYVGSTISSYGLGSIADSVGWNAVFITLLMAAVIPPMLSIVFTLIKNGGINYAKKN